MMKRGFSLILVVTALNVSSMAFAEPAGFAPLRSNTGKQAFAEILLRTCGCGTSTTGTTSTTTTSK